MRGGGGYEPVENETLRLKVYSLGTLKEAKTLGGFIFGNEDLGYILTSYDVKFIKKIEANATDNINGRSITNNTNNAVYIVENPEPAWIYNNIKPIELFPHGLLEDGSFVKSDPPSNRINKDLFPVFEGRNLELFKINKFFNKKIVNSYGNGYGGNKQYTPEEIEFFRTFYPNEVSTAEVHPGLANENVAPQTTFESDA